MTHLLFKILYRERKITIWFDILNWYLYWMRSFWIVTTSTMSLAVLILWQLCKDIWWFGSDNDNLVYNSGYWLSEHIHKNIFKKIECHSVECKPSPRPIYVPFNSIKPNPMSNKLSIYQPMAVYLCGKVPVCLLINHSWMATILNAKKVTKYTWPAINIPWRTAWAKYMFGKHCF